MNKKILFVVAHRDDEVLGIGGTLAKHAENGDEIYGLFLGEENLCRDSSPNLNKEALDAAKILGVKEIYFEDFPDNKFDSIPLLEIIRKIEGYLDKIKPDIVYTHWENDLNIDHRKTYQAVITACRPCNVNSPNELYSFEVLSSTEWQLEGEKFKPNVYADIEKELKKKLEAMSAYKSEVRDYPHPRSLNGIRILAQYRGLECGKEYGEAFRLIRKIT